MNPPPCYRALKLALPALGMIGLSLSTLTAGAANSFLGVAAGDANSTDAILWTRCVDTNAPAAVALTAQVSTARPLGRTRIFP